MRLLTQLQSQNPNKNIPISPGGSWYYMGQVTIPPSTPASALLTVNGTTNTYAPGAFIGDNDPLVEWPNANEYLFEYRVGTTCVALSSLSAGIFKYTLNITNVPTQETLRFIPDIGWYGNGQLNLTYYSVLLLVEVPTVSPKQGFFSSQPREVNAEAPNLPVIGTLTTYFGFSVGQPEVFNIRVPEVDWNPQRYYTGQHNLSVTLNATYRNVDPTKGVPRISYELGGPQKDLDITFAIRSGPGTVILNTMTVTANPTLPPGSLYTWYLEQLGFPKEKITTPQTTNVLRTFTPGDYTCEVTIPGITQCEYKKTITIT